MYGRTFEDFPDRADAFRDALADLGDAEVNAGFELAMRRLKQFPVPAEIREFAAEAARMSRRTLADAEDRRLLEAVKDERFDGTTAEQRRAEFAGMIADAKLKRVARALSKTEAEERLATLKRQADELLSGAGEGAR